ncbi:hypothetical protein LJC42_00370 [Eubacteriales bacterium OttesenSCG-928-K08]|nr:hypothetical protein [Eubacteriales bacterium OttesenSCG-928-K08]
MKLTARQQKWFNLGIEMAKECSSIDEAFYYMDNELANEMNYGTYSNGKFFVAGFKGHTPEWREAYRYGEIPESGRSINYAENKWESGVSVIKLDMDVPSIYDVTLGWQGIEKIKVAGWYFGDSGSDGEALLVDAVKVEG